MIEIKTQQLHDTIQTMYNFIKEHGKCTDESSGQFTGSFYHETYEYNGKSVTYYFDNGKLFAYEGTVIALELLIDILIYLSEERWFKV